MNSTLLATLRRGASAACLLGAALAAGCSSGQSVASLGPSAGPVNSLQPQPDTDIGSRDFVVDPNERGASGQLRLISMSWGRLVDVFDISGTLMARDYVIGENISSNQDYIVETNTVTQRTRVTIRHLAGTDGYESAFLALDQGLTPVQDKSLDPAELGPFSMVPRNAAIVLRFNDLLNPRFDGGEWVDNQNNATVNPETGQLDNQLVQLEVGTPPNDFFEARILVDRNHGDLADHDGDGVQEFHSTRIIMANAISLFEAQQTDPPLSVNTLGLPKSAAVGEPNVVLRIPTKVDPPSGQVLTLRGPRGTQVSFDSSGSRDTTSITNDVVRAFRSGGDQDVTGDLNNGFLDDDTRPNILGNLSGTLVGPVAQDPDDASIFTADSLSFNVADCATLPEVGDVVTQQIQGNVRAEIVSYDSSSGQIENLRLRVVLPVDATIVPGSAQLLTAFDPGSDNPPCFLRFAPEPANAPAAGVSKNSQVFLVFSEPMNPATIKPFDTYGLQRVSSAPDAADFVIASIASGAELREFAVIPSLPLDHTAGNAETYYLRVAPADEGGPTDLAGNPLEFDLPLIPFTLEPTEETESNGGFAFRFHEPSELDLTADEIAGETSLPEFRNSQMVYDLNKEVLRARPVTRRATAVDRDKTLPGNMTQFAAGVQTPLSSLGSKLQALYRYADLGWTVTDETNFNVDIEGLAWAPVGGTVVSDSYSEFQMSLSHSRFLPDETLDSGGFPVFEFSGLGGSPPNSSFALNQIDTPMVVHPKPEGYVVRQSDAFVAESGKTMVPWPLNQEIPVSEYRYWTWRDTRDDSFQGGVLSSGVPLAIELALNNLDPNDAGSVYLPGQVPSVGLPLLMEFRCYPDNEAFGLNPFDISIAVNSSSRPNFRAFSTGGVNSSNQPISRNPDTQDNAMGGFNPGSTPAGLPTPGLDNSFYMGQVETVTRISVAHSLWFDTGFPSPSYVAPVIEPSPSQQPEGTQIVFEYRGATSITQGGDPNASILNTATAGVMDWYGGPRNADGADNGSASYTNGDDSWKTNISAIDGSRFFQVRMTFISNTATNQVPSLDSLGLSFSE